MVVSQAYDSRSTAAIQMVVLKELNYTCRERYYYVRPHQYLGSEKFHSYKIKRVYCYIKVLKKAFGIRDLNMYLLKKMLMKPSLGSLDTLPFGRYDCTISKLMEANCIPSIRLMYSVLSMPGVKSKFWDRINFQEWEQSTSLGMHLIPIRRASVSKV